jgi:hypothetical protein
MSHSLTCRLRLSKLRRSFAFSTDLAARSAGLATWSFGSYACSAGRDIIVCTTNRISAITDHCTNLSDDPKDS